jgi:hypothetical protein
MGALDLANGLVDGLGDDFGLRGKRDGQVVRSVVFCCRIVSS